MEKAIKLCELTQLNYAVTCDTLDRQTGSSSGRKHRRMTPNDVEYIKGSDGRYSAQEIREHTGAGIDAIRKCAKKYKIKLRTQHEPYHQ